MNYTGIGNLDDYYLAVSMTDAAGNVIKELPRFNFSLDRNKDITITQKLDIPGAVLWSPENHSSYILKQQLFKSSLIDIKKKIVSLFDLKSDREAILLNGNEFQLKGTIYYPGSETYGKLISYEQMEKDKV